LLKLALTAPKWHELNESYNFD